MVGLLYSVELLMGERKVMIIEVELMYLMELLLLMSIVILDLDIDMNGVRLPHAIDLCLLLLTHSYFPALVIFANLSN